MIKISQHEDIVNSEIQKLEEAHNQKFHLFQSSNKKDIEDQFNNLHNQQQAALL